MSTNQKYTLDSLTSPRRDLPSPTERRKRQIPTWLLPTGLCVGFLLILGILFGERLIPAVPVSVAPVVTVRSGGGASEVTFQTDSVNPGNTGSGPLLFQASGWVEPDPFAISVSTLVSGIVDEVYVLEGDSVTKGQKLAKLIDEDAVLELEAKKARIETLKSEIESNLAKIAVVESRRKGIESSIRSAESKLAEFEDRYRRFKALPKGSVAAIEVTSAKLQVDQQRAEVEQAKSDLPTIDSELLMVDSEIKAKRNVLREAEVDVAKAELALKRHITTSPMNGTVLRLHAAPGRKRMIHADSPMSSTIVELFDPEKLQARIDVPLNEASSIAIGQPVEITTDLLPNVTLKGTVTRITGEADLQRNTLQVKVAIHKPDSRLRPEMLVRGKFYPLPKAEDKNEKLQQLSRRGTRLSIYVPEEAIFNDEQIWVVSHENTAVLRTLALANETREGHRLATEGIRSGEKVILPPHTKLKPGTRVTVTP
ncbi:MAG: efflux RND transporter periplasmic adaptor subunit [Verrucomicrobiales bacterium]|nr:efflux RND transporter periplasmic adaptor subunit [Verrucomicrobiales bacterium]